MISGAYTLNPLPFAHLPQLALFEASLVVGLIGVVIGPPVCYTRQIIAYYLAGTRLGGTPWLLLLSTLWYKLRDAIS